MAPWDDLLDEVKAKVRKLDLEDLGAVAASRDGHIDPILVSLTCYGCVNEAPGQDYHMSQGGCLDEDCDTYNLTDTQKAVVAYANHLLQKFVARNIPRRSRTGRSVRRKAAKRGGGLPVLAAKLLAPETGIAPGEKRMFKGGRKTRRRKRKTRRRR